MREVDEALMTTTQVMKAIKYCNPRGVIVWCARRGIKPISRQPGVKGENMYSRSEVERVLMQWKVTK